VADAYQQAKVLIARKYADVDLSRIEAKPDSIARRDSLAEDLRDAGAADDAELLAATAALSMALVQNQTMLEAAHKIGVDIERVRAAALKLIDIAGEDVAARIRDSTIQGRLEIRQARGGKRALTHPNTTVYQLTGNTIGKLSTGDGSELDLDDVEQRYLQGLYHECNELPLANEGPVDMAHPRQPRLQHVYVDLHTTSTGGRFVAYRRLNLTEAQIATVEPMLDTFDNKTAIHLENLKKIERVLGLDERALSTALTQPMSIIEALAFNSQLVLLGDPGGGKSTLTRRLAGVLASQALSIRDAAEQQWLDEFTQRFGRWLLPLHIVLSRWAKHLPASAEGNADDLIAEGVRVLAQTAAVTGLKDHLTARLVDGPPSALILLDGLDEVTDAAKRAILLKAVQHFCQRYPQVPLVVTCRIRPWQAWQQADAALPLPAFTIAKLDQASITVFVERWHAELVRAGRYDPTTAAQAQRRLSNAIRDANRPDLADMAGTPLLLTMMARVNYERGLPDSRAELYEAYLRQLLWEWERNKQDDRCQLTSLQQLLNKPSPPVPANNLELALGELAFTIHTSGSERNTVDIPESALRSALEAIHPGQRSERAAWAVEVLDLINERSGLLKSLDDQIFQFSHRTFQEYLAARHLATGDTTTVLEKFRSKIDQEPWSEAIRLALGYQIAVQSQYDTALVVLEELLPDVPTVLHDWRRVLLLGEIYVRLLGLTRSRLAQQRKRADRIIELMPKLLTAAMRRHDLPARQRMEAGLLLAELDIDPAGLDDFVTVEGWTFRIARYPVTNKQYRRFVDAGGYQNIRWWKDKEGQKYKETQGWCEPRRWDYVQFNRSNQPVVGISWYEACAYCAWLTEALHHSGQIDKQEVVRLSTQSEWKQAARSHDGRDYPWGNEFDIAKANTEESDLNQTTPVHMYPQGATPEGVWDLVGNIWEWTYDEKTNGIPWLKGGSWYWGINRSVSAARSLLAANLWDYHIGFRCVVVPISR